MYGCLLNHAMPPGTEQHYLYKNPLKRAVIRVLGDTHYGRVLRYLYLKQALAELDPDPRRILDAGCGRGELTIYLARRYPKAEVLGIDFSASDLAHADQVRLAAKVENVRFEERDLTQPFRDGSFDMMLSWEVIQCVADDKMALRNMYAALAPGGICLIHVMHRTGAYKRVGLRNPLPNGVGRWSDTGQVRAGYTEDELGELMREAGFEQVSARLTFGPWGMRAHSVFEQGRKLPTPIYLGVYPWLVLMGYLDIYTPREWGGAVLAIGYKAPTAR